MATSQTFKIKKITNKIGNSDLLNKILNRTVTSITEDDIADLSVIGRCAFNYCTALESISMPDTVTSIGDYSLEGCTSMTSADISDNVTYIGAGAFYGDTALTSITLPSKLTTIGNKCFYNCTGLSGEFSIPDSVTNIYGQAFYQCSNITKISSDAAFTINTSGVFSYCSKLKELIIPNATINTSSTYGTVFDYAYALETLDVYKLEGLTSYRAFNSAYRLATLIIRSKEAPSAVTASILFPTTTYRAYGTVNSTYNPDGETIKIYIDDDIIDTYKTTSGWSDFADYMYPISDLNNTIVFTMEADDSAIVSGDASIAVTIKRSTLASTYDMTTSVSYDTEQGYVLTYDSTTGYLSVPNGYEGSVTITASLNDPDSTTVSKTINIVKENGYAVNDLNSYLVTDITLSDIDKTEIEIKYTTPTTTPCCIWGKGSGGAANTIGIWYGSSSGDMRQGYRYISYDGYSSYLSDVNTIVTNVKGLTVNGNDVSWGSSSFTATENDSLPISLFTQYDSRDSLNGGSYGSCQVYGVCGIYYLKIVENGTTTHILIPYSTTQFKDAITGNLYSMTGGSLTLNN